MGLLKAISKVRGGYPGGWKQYARGTDRQGATPPFVQPTSPDDRRSLIPPLGLREYWYPALPAKDVGWKKPVGLKMLGTELAFFRDKQGEVQALWDYCPHRGVYLSWGDCFWKGYLSCPYHGATYDGDGECVEFITEGPDSKMVGRLKARKYPTHTLKGLVFVWMGEGEPVPIEEDVPPEFFEQKTAVLYSFRHWDVNWMIALENTGDAHNMFYVHRNSLLMLRSRLGGRPRTPIGYRTKIINDKVMRRMGVTHLEADGASQGTAQSPEQYYEVNGRVPYQLYYPRVGGYWPLHRWRLLWSWLFDIFDRRKRRRPRFQNIPEWEGQRLPGMVRNNMHAHMYTRWAVPVEENLTRAVYFFSSRPNSALGRLYDRLTFHLYLKWVRHFNFSDQDYDAMRSVRYQYPEFLSSTDNPVVTIRKLIVEHGRGLKRPAAAAEESEAERMVAEADSLLEVAEHLMAPGGPPDRKRSP